MTDLRSRYLEAARRVAVSLKERGVEVRLVGSLARRTDCDIARDERSRSCRTERIGTSN